MISNVRLKAQAAVLCLIVILQNVEGSSCPKRAQIQMPQLSINLAGDLKSHLTICISLQNMDSKIGRMFVLAGNNICHWFLKRQNYILWYNRSFFVEQSEHMSKPTM